MKSKLLLFLSLLFGMVQPSLAQRPDYSAACRQAMTKLAYLAGDWEGKATVISQNGPLEIRQTEHVEWRLQDLLLVIEGTGRIPSGEIGFQAFAVVNFDPTDQQYKLRSYVKEGLATNAYFKVVAPNQFEWGFDVPTGKTRYYIHLDEIAKTWKETGEYSADGVTWRKFIDLSLNRK